VSRIQDILAKAERDGTARRTHTDGPLPVSTVVAPMDGATALDPTPFMTPSPDSAHAGAVSTGPAAVPPTISMAPAPSAAPQTRTAHATLHPALVAAIAPHSQVAERYRGIRTRLTLREDRMPLRSIVITSPGARDGKSITAGNLGLTMAQEFQRNVVLVDADLRKPSIHAMFGIEPGPGLADVLTGEATLDEALVYLPDYRLTILTAGSIPQFPTELLGSGAMRRTVDTLRARFDRILLDLPAVAPLADVRTLAPLADGVVLVVRAGVTQRPALEQAVGAFEPHQVLGLVLNDAR
jgi:capsular exopolysaccharide synthesis family protein